jgi:hypothetical protein
MTHKFQVGQSVQLMQGTRYLNVSSSAYKVVKRLPEADGVCSYRVKSASEAYERVVKEDQLVKA